MSSYRIIRFSHVAYPRAREAFTAAVPDPSSLPYAKMQETLFNLSLVYSNSFSKAMRDLGNEAQEIVYDLEPMQKAWAREFGANYNEEDWEIPIALRQIATIKPDVIFFQDMTLPYPYRKYLKDMFPFVKLTLGMRSYPSLFDELRGFDVFFTGAPLLVEIFRQHGLEAKLLYHAFDNEVLPKLTKAFGPTGGPDINFSFVGASGCGRGIAQSDRYWALYELARRTDIKFWLDETTNQSVSERESPPRGLKAQIKNLFFTPAPPENKRDDPVIPLRRLFPDRFQGTAFGLDMYDVLQRSQVTFNRHVNLDIAEVGNMRMFEATGVGACLLTDTGRNMRALFEPDTEVLTYESIDECIEKYKYISDHDDTGRAIAAAGQRRTLRDHTVHQRCQAIDEIIRQLL